MKNNKTEIIGFRVTKEELEAIKEMVNLQGKTISQWCKQIIVKMANGDNKNLSLLNLGENIILEQLVLLRFILTTTLGDKELTDDKIKRIIKKANEMKNEKAQQLIAEFISDLGNK